ncbi:hypothetical protein BGZ83_001591 [Gryganskiella cystojenkinii]|nr:hypothetical protein BGZ83_001591 [Gryganskiella cystojenkinii]
MLDPNPDTPTSANNPDGNVILNPGSVEIAPPVGNTTPIEQTTNRSTDARPTIPVVAGSSSSGPFGRTTQFSQPPPKPLTLEMVMVLMKENTQLISEAQNAAMMRQMSVMESNLRTALQTQVRDTVEAALQRPVRSQEEPRVRIITPSGTSRPRDFKAYREQIPFEEEDDGVHSSTTSELGSPLETTYSSTPIPPPIRPSPPGPNQRAPPVVTTSTAGIRNSEERFQESAGRWINPPPPVQTDRPSRLPLRSDAERKLEYMIQAVQKIKKYDGPVFDCVPLDGLNPKVFIDDWLIEFDRWFTTQVGDPDTHGLLPSTLQVLGRAVTQERAIFEWLNNRIEDDPFQTWSEVQQELSLLLMPIGEKMRRGTMQVVTDCVQGNVSVALYIARFNACVKIYNHYRNPMTAPDSLLIAHSFYKGITDSLLRDRIWIRCDQDVSSLDRVQKIAVETERDMTRQNVILGKIPGLALPITPKNTVVPNPQTGISSTASKVVNNPSPPASITNPVLASATMETLAQQLSSLTLLLNQQATTRDARNYSPRPSNGPPRDMSKIECFNCKQYGHYSNRCPEPKTEQTLIAQQRFNTMLIEASSPDEGNESHEPTYDVLFTQAHMEEFMTEQILLAEAAFVNLHGQQDFHQG